MDEEKRIEVRYTFFLPEHSEELAMIQKAPEYMSALHDIYEECRKIWKYDDDASKELVEFAERIGEISGDVWMSR